MTSKVVVTGGTGFIGRHLLQLLAEQRLDVHALARDPSALEAESRQGITVHACDLRDPATFHAALEGADVVYHLAGLTRAKSRAAFDVVNADATRMLARACGRMAPGLKRFVLVSSLAAAGPGTPQRPRSESDPAAPVSHYGASKLAGERALQEEFAPDWASRWTIVRPPIVFGPGDRDVLALIRSAQAGWGLMPAGPERSFSVVFAPDLCESLVCLAQTPGSEGRIVHAAHAQAYAHSVMLDAMGDAVGRRVRKLRLPGWLTGLAAAGGSAAQHFLKRPPILTLDKHREVRAPGWVMDSQLLQNLLPGACSTSLEAGLAPTVEWYRRHGWLRA